MLITWTFNKENLTTEHRKVMVTGYEFTIFYIQCCLESFARQSIREMNKSIFRYYMKLPDTVTRSDNISVRSEGGDGAKAMIRATSQGSDGAEPTIPARTQGNVPLYFYKI